VITNPEVVLYARRLQQILSLKQNGSCDEGAMRAASSHEVGEKVYTDWSAENLNPVERG
jgi:hypothetical protein